MTITETTDIDNLQPGRTYVVAITGNTSANPSQIRFLDAGGYHLIAGTTTTGEFADEVTVPTPTLQFVFPAGSDPLEVTLRPKPTT